VARDEDGEPVARAERPGRARGTRAARERRELAVRDGLAGEAERWRGPPTGRAGGVGEGAGEVERC
jgi:hypothetical protein